MEKDIILKATNISKQYRLGQVGTGTLSHDINRWWHKIRGKEDPYLKIGEVNDRSIKGTSDYVWALQDINFEVERGEVLGIIGKNGAGKSTLLKILSKVTAPTTGSIKSRGRIASLLEVGTGFNGEMTGRENIYLNGAILGMTKKEISSKLDEIIEFSGCERYIDTPVKRYSSGMTVRLAFAVAAFLEPEILVVDEVLAVGDAEFQKKAIGKMQDISKGEGRTVLFVSHNMAAIKQLCTKTIILNNGTILFDGTTSEGIDLYFNLNEKSKIRNGIYNSASFSQNPFLKKVRVVRDHKENLPCVKFYHDEDILLEMEYVNEIPIVTFCIGIAVLDIHKNKLFTNHFDFQQSKDKFKTVYCRIPKNIFNQGVYSFDVAIFQKGGTVFNYLDDICEFEVIDKGSELYYQVNENIGALKVNCQWEIS
ncbi:ABC transporter ATP-binding protein [Flavobacterium olei]|uniref:ABC transporter ATP-binding protein n=1 Tax=Flavobacterium olei TaxID=1886782 RepID=UPI00321C2F0D